MKTRRPAALFLFSLAGLAPLSAAAYIPPFEKILPALVKGKERPALVVVRRTLVPLGAGERGTVPEKQPISEKLIFAEDGRFRLESEGPDGKKLLFWDGREGFDWIAGAGYCPRRQLGLDLVERLIVAASAKELRRAAAPLGVDFSQSALVFGPGGFINAYGAGRPGENKGQLYVDPKTQRVAGFALAASDGQPRQTFFLNLKEWADGFFYPQRIEIFLQGKPSYAIAVQQVSVERAVAPRIFDRAKALGSAALRSTCLALESQPEAEGGNPQSWLREFDQRFGR
jgi:hypothetical protein